jgi:putative FmdB family regulatory protein
MPTYEYICKNCGHTFEEFQSIVELPLKTCPECHTDELVRALGTGGGLIFKGSGFYLTDYKKNNSSPVTKPKTDSGGESKDTAPKPAANPASPEKKP